LLHTSTKSAHRIVCSLSAKLSNGKCSLFASYWKEEKCELEQVDGGRRQAVPHLRQHPDDEDGDTHSNDDDVHSIATVTAHELERVEEEDEEQLVVEEEERGHRRDGFTRP
jgi:hypothetical protein